MAVHAPSKSPWQIDNHFYVRFKSHRPAYIGKHPPVLFWAHLCTLPKGLNVWFNPL